jgi:cytochrome c peroxidase
VRNASYNLYLPATATHPTAAEPFRAIPNAAQPGLTDLGIWNIFANPDIPKPQSNLNLILCQLAMKDATPPASLLTTCTQTALLPKTIGVFKTPGLRDLDHSAPYMHTGQFDTLTDVLNFYQQSSQSARAGTLRNAARELKGMALKPADLPALVAFLKSLNEDYQ